MGNAEPLALPRMLLIQADYGARAVAEQHPGNLALERFATNIGSKRLREFLYLHWNRKRVVLFKNAKCRSLGFVHRLVPPRHVAHRR